MNGAALQREDKGTSPRLLAAGLPCGKTLRERLRNEGIRNPGAIGPIRYVPSETRPIDIRLDGLRLSKVPTTDLAAFKTGMKAIESDAARFRRALGEVWRTRGRHSSKHRPCSGNREAVKG